MGDERSKGFKRTFLLGCHDQGATSGSDQFAADLNPRLVGLPTGRKGGTYGNTGLTGLVLVCKGNPFRD
jgi:hypothetical protein